MKSNDCSAHEYLIDHILVPCIAFDSSETQDPPMQNERVAYFILYKHYAISGTEVMPLQSASELYHLSAVYKFTKQFVQTHNIDTLSLEGATQIFTREKISNSFSIKLNENAKNTTELISSFRDGDTPFIIFPSVKIIEEYFDTRKFLVFEDNDTFAVALCAAEEINKLSEAYRRWWKQRACQLLIGFLSDNTEFLDFSRIFLDATDCFRAGTEMFFLSKNTQHKWESIRENIANLLKKFLATAADKDKKKNFKELCDEFLIIGEGIANHIVASRKIIIGNRDEKIIQNLNENISWKKMCMMIGAAHEPSLIQAHCSQLRNFRIVLIDLSEMNKKIAEKINSTYPYII